MKAFTRDARIGEQNQLKFHRAPPISFVSISCSAPFASDYEDLLRQTSVGHSAPRPTFWTSEQPESFFKSHIFRVDCNNSHSQLPQGVLWTITPFPSSFSTFHDSLMKGLLFLGAFANQSHAREHENHRSRFFPARAYLYVFLHEARWLDHSASALSESPSNVLLQDRQRI